MLSLLLPAAPSRDELFARHGERYRWLALFTVAIGVIAAVLATTSFSVAIRLLQGAAAGVQQPLSMVVVMRQIGRAHV